MSETVNTPDPLAPWKTKKNDLYGSQYANLIYREWFEGGMNSNKSEYVTRRDWIRNKRLSVRGEQNDQQFKDQFERQKGDLDFVNLDWRIINIGEKFCRVVSNGTKDEFYTLDIRANDRFTLINNKKEADQHRKNMRSLPLMKQAQQLLKIPLVPPGFIPEDEDELLLHKEIKGRPKIEIAEEIIIDYVKKVSGYNNIEDDKNFDLVVIGIAAARNFTNPVNGVGVDYVDPEYLIHSRVKKNDFSDAYYFGYVDENVTIHDVQLEANFNEETLRKIANTYVGSNNSASIDWDGENINKIMNLKVNILRFAFKTNKTKVYKKHLRDGETTHLSKKDQDFEVPENVEDYAKLVRTKSTWMEGNFIIGSQDIIYGYKECENIIRDEQNKAISPFTVRATSIYKNQLHSFFSNIEPLVDQMQYQHNKIQHLISELKPDIIIINEDALADLREEGEKKSNWEKALNLLNVKGVVVEKTIDMGEMGIAKNQVVKQSAVQQGSALTPLLNTWAHYYNVIRDITGINMARDGSLDQDALLGVNQMAQLASNTATKHIVDASIDFNIRVAEAISSRVHNIFKSKNAEHLKKLYQRAVGKDNIEALEALKNRHLHDFGFTVEMVPTKQEIDNFREDLGIALKEGSIDVEIKNEALRIARTNMKLASKYLFYMRKKLKKEQMDDEAQLAKNKSENDIQAGNKASENRTIEYQNEKKVDLEYEAQITKIKVLEKQAMQQIEAPVKEKEFKQQVFLKTIDAQKEFGIKNFLEDRKDDRTKIQAGQQSRLIPERKSENPKPINFEDDSFSNIFNLN